MTNMALDRDPTINKEKEKNGLRRKKLLQVRQKEIIWERYRGGEKEREREMKTNLFKIKVLVENVDQSKPVKMSPIHK